MYVCVGFHVCVWSCYILYLRNQQHKLTLWREIFAGVYFGEFSKLSGDSGKLNLVSDEKNPQKIISFLYMTEFQLN